MVKRTSEKVRAFRARFDGVREDEQAERATLAAPEERLDACLALHAFNLLVALQRVMAQLGTDDPNAAVPELNRQRLEQSPMPRSLTEQARRLPHGAKTRPE